MHPFSLQFEAIGTLWDITAQISQNNSSELAEKIKKRINTFDKNYSRFRKDSIVYKIQKTPGVYTMPQDFDLMMTLYESLYRLTNGLFTPLIGDLLVSSGYDMNYSFKQGTLKNVLKWENTIDYRDLKLHIKTATILDFGGVGKGYLIDIISDIIREYSNSFIIDAGGDILTIDSSNRKIKIGLEHPADNTKIIGVCEIQNKSICASSGNRRRWGKFHHIINPETKSSPQNIISTWVISDTAVISDALATCLFLVKPGLLEKAYKFEYLVLFDDYTFSISKNFPGELYT
ncbi:MAG: FAD:protein FMN transferase [Candidatus Levybacteria bacterium]|nr:FAD:protein FMN transferase [Candidatus Levybacteria bacterium]MBP9815598.1 FAD:protein FMN transferase [Candidatus Levybacteria bacterium]